MSKLLTNTLWKFAERVIAQLLTLVVSVVLARILTPDDYGTVSIVLVFITLADVLITSGLSTALVQKKTSDELDYSSAFIVSAAASFIIYIVMLVSAPAIAVYYDKPILTAVIRVLGVRVLISSYSSIQNAYVARHMMFRK